MNIKKTIIILLYAFIGWVLCGATIGISNAVTSEETALIIHAITVPVIFAVIAFAYFKKFNYTTPLQIIIIFLAFAVFMDIFVVSVFIEKSFEMFSSVIGTWIPLTLIFISTYLTGLFTNKHTLLLQK